MPQKSRLDPAKAFRLARMLERHVKLHEPHATKAMRRVVAELAVSAISALRAVPSLEPCTVALAILIENPGLSDAEIARRAGVNRATLARDARYQRSRELVARGKESVARNA